jgi:hypothetical protein
MKHITLVLLLSLLLVKPVSAQNDTMKSTPQNAHVFFATAKFHLTDNLHDLEGMNTLNLKIATNVEPTVMNAFSKAFKKANNDKWFYYDKKGKIYLVKFDSDQKDYKALLNKKGKVFYTMYDASEKELSEETKKNLKAWFGDYNIIGLVNVNAPNKNESIVNLKHDKELVVVSVENDVIAEMGRYKFDQGFTIPVSTKVKSGMAKK